MKIIQCEQGSSDWWLARSGIPTASEFDRIVTPPDYRDKYDCGHEGCAHTSENAAKKCKKGEGKAIKYQDVGMRQSVSINAYRNKLLAEWLRGKPDEGFQSEWMKRGHEVEAEARSAYAFITDTEPEQVGFCLRNRVGCSPDALVNEDGGLEVKAPSPGVHVGYLLDGRVPLTYRVQILGSLYVTQRDWWDFCSYHPDLEPLIIRTWRKDVEKELEALHEALMAFVARLDKAKAQLIERGYTPKAQEAA